MSKNNGYSAQNGDSEQTWDEYDADASLPVDETVDGALDEALEGETRAEELRRIKALLVERRSYLLADMREADETEKKKLRRDIAKLDEQIRVLAEEANISQFVEDAVRVGIEMRKLQN